jgi:hypothetical protein
VVKRVLALLLPTVLLVAQARAQDAKPGEDAKPPETKASETKASETKPPETKPQEPKPHERSTDMDKQEAGFGQEEDEQPRLPRIRLELSALGGWFDTEFREGKAGLSNRFDVQSDLGLPRFMLGFRAAGAVKVHRFLSIGGEYFRFSAEGPRTIVHSDFRLGSLPAEAPPFTAVRGTMELQQASFTLRFVAADDNEIRAEFSGGVTWVSCRVGLHPQPPFPPLPPGGRLPGGGLSAGASASNEAWLAPAIGTFFAWNFHPHVGIFLDSTSSYFSFYPSFGSLASINRVGFRFRIWAGLEVVAGAFLVSGQVYDIKDRLNVIGVSSNHTFHQASWIGGGPELGLSFTY